MNARSAQASIELVVALLALMLVVAGLLHIANLGKASLYLSAALRGRAGKSALSAGTLGYTERYISAWRVGADQLAHTADDTPVYGSSAALELELLSRSARSAGDWSLIAPETRLPRSMASLYAGECGLLEFARAEDTIHVELSRVIRQLVLDKPEIAIKQQLWIPLTGGLY